MSLNNVRHCLCILKRHINIINIIIEHLTCPFYNVELKSHVCLEESAYFFLVTIYAIPFNDYTILVY